MVLTKQLLRPKLLNGKTMKKGYSLIELTIVVGLISVLSVTISGIVLSTIVNSTRIRNQVKLRQAGDYAIGQMNTLIRNSRSINSCNSLSSTVTINNIDGGTTDIMLEGTQIASNSGVYLTPSDLEISNFTLSCLPDDTDPRLINILFTLTLPGGGTGKASESPTETFSTSAEIKNN